MNLMEPGCCPALDAPLTAGDADRLARLLKALADPARLRLVSIIAASGEACACTLTEPLGLSQPTVSHHLKVLTEAGVLSREKRGVWAWFRIAPGALEAIAGALSPAREDPRPARRPATAGRRRRPAAARSR